MLTPSPRQFVGAFEMLFSKLRFKLHFLRPLYGYPGEQTVVDFLAAAGVPEGYCCYEMVLVKEM